MDVTRAGGLLLSGYSRRQLTRLAQRGEIVRVRHGAYADSVPAGELERHTQLIAATWPAVDPATVLSHGSAAVLHGLPVWTDALARVTVIRRTTGHGSRRTSLHVRLAALRPDEVVSVDGYQVTSLERTGCDLACILRYERAVAVLDAVLHRGGDPEVLAQTVGEAKGRRGAGRARAALIFADGRSESVAESVSRVRMSQVGIPSPQLQVNIFDENGTWVARSDFGWLESGVLGEFDGRIKYLGTADEVAAAVMKEKAREARLRELGWVVVRWDWADLGDPQAFRRRIEAAFAQANPANLRGWAEPL
jgi:hypothetical protein